MTSFFVLFHKARVNQRPRRAPITCVCSLSPCLLSSLLLKSSRSFFKKLLAWQRQVNLAQPTPQSSSTPKKPNEGAGAARTPSTDPRSIAFLHCMLWELCCEGTVLAQQLSHTHGQKKPKREKQWGGFFLRYSSITPLKCWEDPCSSLQDSDMHSLDVQLPKLVRESEQGSAVQAFPQPFTKKSIPMARQCGFSPAPIKHCSVLGLEVLSSMPQSHTTHL